jgi:transposase InsO family protein
MIELARRYGRYGYRRIVVFLRQFGWSVNDKRIERLWRREGVKVTAKQPKRERLWFNVAHAYACEPACQLRLVLDFVQDWTHDGRAFRTLNVIDEYTRECLTIKVKGKLNIH